jgi:hypothetical protein
MTAGRRHRIGQLPEAEAAIVGMNIRTLRQRNRWTQAKLGELNGLAERLDRMRRRRPPQRTAKGHHRQGSPATGRHLRRTFRAAHGAVCELQRPAARRVRLPGMRSH